MPADGMPTRPVCYIDSHRKPVYSDGLLLRGLIGRTGCVRVPTRSAVRMSVMKRHILSTIIP